MRKILIGVLAAIAPALVTAQALKTYPATSIPLKISAYSILCNPLGSVGVPSQCTASQVKSLLAISAGDVSGAAPLASPALTGTPTAPTAAANDNTTKVATTAYVDRVANGTTLAVLASGTAGQVLTKNSSTAYDIVWGNFASVGGPVTVHYQPPPDYSYAHCNHALSSSGVYHDYFCISADISNSGSDNTTALYGRAEASGTTSHVWSLNTVCHATAAGGVCFPELDAGTIVAGGLTYGLVVASTGYYPAVNAFQVQTNRWAAPFIDVMYLNTSASGQAFTDYAIRSANATIAKGLIKAPGIYSDNAIFVSGLTVAPTPTNKLVSASITGNGTTATASFVSTVNPPWVGAPATYSGYGNAGFNVTATTTASSLTSASFLNSTNASSTNGAVAVNNPTLTVTGGSLSSGTCTLSYADASGIGYPSAGYKFIVDTVVASGNASGENLTGYNGQFTALTGSATQVTYSCPLAAGNYVSGGTIAPYPVSSVTAQLSANAATAPGNTAVLKAISSGQGSTDASVEILGLGTGSVFLDGTSVFVDSSSRINSTVATGTVPLVVASTTNIPNLNVSLLNGHTFADPGPVGSGTPSTGAFTTVAGTSGTLAGLTSFGLRDTSAAFDAVLAAASSTALTASRTLTFDLKNVAHTLALGATANTVTFPNAASYTLIGSGDSATVTNTMLAGGITLANLATQATNTVVGNATSGTASPTALAVGTCSTTASALTWTTNTGFGCNTAINAAALGGATFANPGEIGTTPAKLHGTSVTSVPTAAATTDAGNVGYTALSSGVPFIFDTCTVSTAGALSACTSLPSEFSAVTTNAYMWFNASILASSGLGSAAGFYYVQMTSQTVGIACLTSAAYTLYSSGSPAIPASCTQPGAASIPGGTNTIPATIMQGPTFTLPAHSMGLSGSLECDTAWSQTNSANTRTMTLKFGSANTLMAPTTVAQATENLKIVNAGSESAQALSIVGNTSTVATMVSAQNVRTTVATSSNQTISWNETMNTSTEFAVLEHYACKVFPN